MVYVSSYRPTTFQSTLPVRGATVSIDAQDTMPMISIHAPREGSDRICGGSSARRPDFNPRSP